MQVAPNYADLDIIKGIALCESKKKEEGIVTLQKSQELNDPRAEGPYQKNIQSKWDRMNIKKYQHFFNNTILNLL